MGQWPARTTEGHEDDRARLRTRRRRRHGVRASPRRAGGRRRSVGGRCTGGRAGLLRAQVRGAQGRGRAAAGTPQGRQGHPRERGHRRGQAARGRREPARGRRPRCPHDAGRGARGRRRGPQGRCRGRPRGDPRQDDGGPHRDRRGGRGAGGLHPVEVHRRPVQGAAGRVDGPSPGRSLDPRRRAGALEALQHGPIRVRQGPPRALRDARRRPQGGHGRQGRHHRPRRGPVDEHRLGRDRPGLPRPDGRVEGRPPRRSGR